MEWSKIDSFVVRSKAKRALYVQMIDTDRFTVSHRFQEKRPVDLADDSSKQQRSIMNWCVFLSFPFRFLYRKTNWSPKSRSSSWDKWWKNTDWDCSLDLRFSFVSIELNNPTATVDLFFSAKIFDIDLQWSNNFHHRFVSLEFLNRWRLRNFFV